MATHREQVESALSKISRKEGLVFPFNPASKHPGGVWAAIVLKASLRQITGNKRIEVAYLVHENTQHRLEEDIGVEYSINTETHIRCEGEEDITIPNTSLINMIRRMLDA